MCCPQHSEPFAVEARRVGGNAPYRRRDDRASGLLSALEEKIEDDHTQRHEGERGKKVEEAAFLDVGLQLVGRDPVVLKDRVRFGGDDGLYGRIFAGDKVRKNRTIGRFEDLP